MSSPQIIRHLHLPGTTPFARVTAIQNVLVRRHLDHKAVSSSLIHAHPVPPAPPPTIFSFSPTPVYTTGRRELGTLSKSTIELLKRPLETAENGRQKEIEEMPEVRETLRGGQITFHGPGQLVIYPILDLKSVRSEKWPRGLSVRCYVNVLEEATIKTLKTFGIVGFRTVNPGVWVDKERKVAALGLHLRRNITNYGVGLNVRTDLRYFDKIVACGLEGKKTTSIKQELWQGKSLDEWATDSKNRAASRSKAQYLEMSNRMNLSRVSRVWGKEFTELVWGEGGVYKQQCLKTEKAVAGFLDNGEGRWVE
jgi:lipoyl(octanoyl) transferase